MPSTQASTQQSQSQSSSTTSIIPGLQANYQDLLDKNMANYQTMLGTYGNAAQQLGQNLAGIYPQYQGIQNQVMNTLGMGQVLGQNGNWGVAGPAATAIGDAFKQAMGGTVQQLTSGGLGQSTLLGNLQNQNALQAGRAYAGLGAQLASTAAGWQGQLGLAQAAAQMTGAGLQNALNQSYLGDLAGWRAANTFGNITGQNSQSTSTSSGASSGSSSGNYGGSSTPSSGGGGTSSQAPVFGGGLNTGTPTLGTGTVDFGGGGAPTTTGSLPPAVTNTTGLAGGGNIGTTAGSLPAGITNSNAALGGQFNPATQGSQGNLLDMLQSGAISPSSSATPQMPTYPQAPADLSSPGAYQQYMQQLNDYADQLQAYENSIGSGYQVVKAFAGQPVGLNNPGTMAQLLQGNVLQANAQSAQAQQGANAYNAALVAQHVGSPTGGASGGVALGAASPQDQATLKAIANQFGGAQGLPTGGVLGTAGQGAGTAGLGLGGAGGGGTIVGSGTGGLQQAIVAAYRASSPDQANAILSQFGSQPWFRGTLQQMQSSDPSGAALGPILSGIGNAFGSLAGFVNQLPSLLASADLSNSYDSGAYPAADYQGSSSIYNVFSNNAHDSAYAGDW